MLGRATGKFELTRFTTARTWGKPPPSPLYYTLCLATGPHPNVILSRDSQVGVPKFPQFGLPRLWGSITLRANLRLRWGLKQSYSPRRELSKYMLHTTWTWGNRSDYRLLVVGNQITNLIHDPSFGHNLCFECPNGSCKPILDIYAPRYFQW